MDWMDRFSLFEPMDFAAAAAVLCLWRLSTWLVENSNAKRPAVSAIMAQHRREWMQQMLHRQNRIFDAQTIGTLRQGTSFFASTCVIAIGGTLALIGNAERLAGVANDFVLDAAPVIVWEVKLVFLTFFLAAAFLNFVWSHRLFGYCSVLIAATPNDSMAEHGPKTAGKAAEINITAARSYNRGLRSMYFGLATTAWLAGPFALFAAGLITFIVIWRREFASRSRAILLD